MTASHIEREDKFDVEADFAVPDVADLLPPGAEVSTSSQRLVSYYFDTADLDLLRAGLTLRRRTGDADQGWQLKVPHKPAREEIRLPDKGRSVPAELRSVLLGVSRRRPLKQVAKLTTERSVHRLQDVDGGLLAEIDDDTVHASAGGAALTVTGWREVEVELGNGDEDLLAALGQRLRKAGAAPSTASSKLARLLLSPTATEGASTRSALEPVLAYVAEQQLTLLAGDLALRRQQDDVIHKTRVAARRLRSTLRTFRNLFEPDRATALDGELRWFAGLLGEVRDRQVLRDRLDRLVGELPEESVLGPVRTRIHTELDRERTEHWQRLQEEMTGERYLGLLESLASWVAEPPFASNADKSASRLPKMVERAERKVTRRLSQANASADVDDLHRARKAAKRARYAAELIEPVTGAKAAHKLARRYQGLQDLLGEHQDSLVSAALLRRLGAKAGTTRGENG
ncbi:MAG: CYTH and CHAD domain-containing protein, partial [Actinomycetota bacterium]|nr:CYTH and CHAD domain-containing protein [Actinomycetota bacterium]